MTGEVPIVTAKASVMIYDDAIKKWLASGSSQGLSKVQIYQHTSNNTFRVVGRKIQDHEVVINCAILKGLKYNKATPTFHQWRDNRQVYGLNFTSKEEADNFYQAMTTALDTLSGIYRTPPPVAPPPQPPQQPLYQQINGPQDTEPERLQRDEYKTHQRQLSAGSGGIICGSTGVKDTQPVSMSIINSNPGMMREQAHPNPPAAPPAPPVPPAAPPPPVLQTQTPAAPPPPPPPPPPMPSAPSAVLTTTAPGGGLAEALQKAKLKKVAKPEESASGGGDVAGGAQGSGMSTLARPHIPGAEDMMSEMQRKLAARRAKTENPPPQQQQELDSSSPDIKKSREKNNTSTNGNGNKFNQTNGSESPKIGQRRKISLSGQDLAAMTNGGSATSCNDLDALRQDIVTEIRREMQKMKAEILDVIRQELSGR